MSPAPSFDEGILGLVFGGVDLPKIHWGHLGLFEIAFDCWMAGNLFNFLELFKRY